MAVADKVAVYLVGHDPKIVLLNNTGCLFQLLLRPHSAAGVLWIAPENELAGRVGALIFKIVKVGLKCAVGLFEHGRGQDTDTGVLGGVGKIAVCGGIHEHLLILGTQGLGKLIKRRNYAG